MEYFVNKDSIVRQIWGKADTILFIFAGAAAEFALNKSVDWLYFTGKLPSDPLGRLFSTVGYARTIVFSETEAANHAIDVMTAIHSKVEEKRGSRIPDRAYRDVLFMLIDYSIRAYEVFERRLTSEEKQEVLEVFYRVGSRMEIKGLPEGFQEWEIMRSDHLNQNLEHSHFTGDLYTRYRKNLGGMRYRLLLEAQKMVVPKKVSILLGFHRGSLLNPLITIYKYGRRIKLDLLLKSLILPSDYKKKISELDIYQPN